MSYVSVYVSGVVGVGSVFGLGVVGSGVSGVVGVSGTVGVSGVSGTVGVVGVSGTVGTSGVVGVSGTVGAGSVECPLGAGVVCTGSVSQRGVSSAGTSATLSLLLLPPPQPLENTNINIASTANALHDLNLLILFASLSYCGHFAPVMYIYSFHAVAMFTFCVFLL